jgi:hypothetical protein
MAVETQGAAFVLADQKRPIRRRIVEAVARKATQLAVRAKRCSLIQQGRRGFETGVGMADAVHRRTRGRRGFRSFVRMTGYAELRRGQNQHPGILGAMRLMTGLAEDRVPIRGSLASGVQNHLGNRGFGMAERMLTVALLGVLRVACQAERRIDVGLAQKDHGAQVGVAGYRVGGMARGARHTALCVQRKLVGGNVHSRRRRRIRGMVTRRPDLEPRIDHRAVVARQAHIAAARLSLHDRLHGTLLQVAAVQGLHPPNVADRTLFAGVGQDLLAPGESRRHSKEKKKSGGRAGTLRE